MRNLRRESARIQRQAVREYVRQRVTLRAREVQRETAAEIRAALAAVGIEPDECAEVSHAA